MRASLWLGLLIAIGARVHLFTFAISVRAWRSWLGVAVKILLKSSPKVALAAHQVQQETT